MKIYDNDWYLHHGLSYDQAAEMLDDWGASFVIAQSRFLPMPDTAVKSEIPPELASRFAAYDDRRFRDALARRGIRYIASCLMFFDPAALAADPAMGAIDADGRPMEKIDWYIGIPPTSEAHISNKTRAIERVVRELEPDGVHLGFMRWPGFWELWMPHHERKDFPEYSYDSNTLKRFTAETDNDVPIGDPAAAAGWIENNARGDWTDWKCRTLVDVIRGLGDAARRLVPDIEIVLNTVPFGKNDFENAEEAVFGQSFELLAPVVDVFEVMAYHQILKRPPDWISGIADEVKSRSGRSTVCTVQAAPLYLDGVHSAQGRSPDIGHDEFRACVGAAKSSTADGVVFFLWSDFLREVLLDGDNRRLDIIRQAGRG
jgi:hypothetical protein